MRSVVKRAGWADISRPAIRLVTAGTSLVVAVMAAVPAARADAVAYLINVTVRPGYNFPNADQALAYGHTICSKVAAGRSYAEVMTDVKADFATRDEFQASYLITQAVNELCPGSIWQLRHSAAGYRPPGQ